jgi:SanA protein
MRYILKLLRNAFYAIAGLAILGCIAILLINFYVKDDVKDRIITPESATNLNADCILVLGAGVYNGFPTAMLQDRLEQGIALYEAGTSGKLLMSGDHGRNEYDEVNVMKKYAVDKGVPSENVFMDHAGFSTYESLYRARDVFLVKKLIIVTQEYHMYRALYIAERLGLEAYGVAADPREYAGQSYREAREVLARAKDCIYALVKPRPTYLGEPIPVHGNGDITND